MPPPYNSIIVGGAKPLTVKSPELFVNTNEEDKQMPGVPEYYSKWPAQSIVDWKGSDPAEFERTIEQGGVWTGGEC